MIKSKVKKLCLFSLFFISLIISNQIFSSQFVRSNNDTIQNEYQIPFNEGPKTSADKENYEIIEEVFSQKLADYSTLGYFPQAYEPSLHATYYALYSLNALGRLDQVNQTEMERYFMSHYDEESNFFVDKYVYRYLDSDISFFYFPLSTLLEVNCYAILSLDILGRLDLINVQESIEFIWSCFNPVGSENGFIGQPYDVNLVDNYKVATMDNTYFAVKTLDLLMDDWNGHADERSKIVAFINTLQNSDGSFNNDLDNSFYSLDSWENNIQASYYCVKTLDMFGMVNTINIEEFNSYLENLYIPQQEIFCFYSKFFIPEMKDIIGTSLGLELSDITGFTNYDRNNVVQFVLNNRNSIGNWDSSTLFQYHELIYTFQVIRSLSDSGVIALLNSEEKDEIASAIALYHQNEGYSLLSEDYMSIDLIYTIVKSFKLYDRISDLDIQGLYLKLQDCYFEDLGFVGSTNMNRNSQGFRSYPIEYYNLGYRSERSEAAWIFNHKFTYKALYSLLKTFKLDDFESNYDLTDIIDGIVGSQFLEPGYENFGGFLPFQRVSPGLLDYNNISIFLECSYYAIKSLELLTNYLDLGSILNLTFNKGALFGYIQRNIVESESTIHFDPEYTSDVEIILMNTYQMIYILKALNLYDLYDLKIEEFVRQTINYDNIVNIYYSFKISEILGFNIEFDYDKARISINNLYSEQFKEFYVSPDFQDIEQEAFLWVCDMVKNDKITIECNYTEALYLGSVNTITATINNIVFDKFGADYIVKFESSQFGSVNLEKQYDNLYSLNFMVPKALDYYPCVDGFLTVYDNGKVVGQVPIHFETAYEFNKSSEKSIHNGMFHFDVNVSRRFLSEYESLDDSWVIVEVFVNKSLYETINLSREDHADHSGFTFHYKYKNDVHCLINVSFFDSFHPNGLYLFYMEHHPPPEPFTVEITGTFLGMGGLVITSLVGVGTIKVGERIKDKKKRRNGSNAANDNEIKKKNHQESAPESSKSPLKKHFYEKWSDEE